MGCSDPNTQKQFENHDAQQLTDKHDSNIKQPIDKNADGVDKLRGRCDSFVVETDVHFPTDINLLFDAVRKVVELIALLCIFCGSSLWNKSNVDIQELKRLYRKVQKLKHSTSKDEDKKKKQEDRIIEAHQDYIELAMDFMNQAEIILAILARFFGEFDSKFIEIRGFIVHAKRQIDQIERRVINGEKIPHDEKVSSLFEEHTEWISKGKAGVPVELGVKVCVVEDQYGFILHHQVMQHTTDDKIAAQIIKETKALFPTFSACSFDKGFYSPENLKELTEILDLCILPKKGKLSKKDQEIEYAEEFKEGRRKHSAVESGINALEVHGLDKCPDHGIDGFKRYVALAVLARNIQKIGAIKQKNMRELQKEEEKRKLAA